MAIPRKGARRIVVSGEPYLWTIRRKPTYAQGLTETGLTVAIEHEHDGGQTLHVHLTTPRPDNWLGVPGQSIRPSDIGQFIREALKRGWEPDKPGRTFELGPSSV